MAAVSSFITDIRHDLRDFAGVEYSDDELIKYLNRAIWLLNNYMCRIDHDWMLESDDVTLSSGNNYTGMPTSCNTVRQVWYDQDMLIKKTPHWIYAYREMIDRTSTGTPNYWAQHQGNILFDYVADANYTLRCIYQKDAAAMTDTNSTLPWSSEWDHVLRQATLIQCRATKDKTIVPVEQQLESMFKEVLARNAVTTRYTPKKYYLDF